MANPDFSNEESGQTSWPLKLKRDIDEFISREDETTEREISKYKEWQKELDKIGVTDQAKRVEDLIEGIIKSSAERQKLRKYITLEMRDLIIQQNDFKRGSIDTIRHMKEDINDES